MRFKPQREPPHPAARWLLRRVVLSLLLLIAVVLVFSNRHRASVIDELTDTKKRSALENVQFRLKSLNQQSNELSKELSNLRDFLRNAGSKTSKCLPDKNSGIVQGHVPINPGNTGNQRSAINPNNGDDPLKDLLDVSVSRFLIRDYIVGLEHIQSSNDIKPAFHWTKGRKGVNIVIGVPTVHRDAHSYLIDTLTSLFNNMNVAERDDCLFVVFIGETEKSVIAGIAEQIRQSFSEHLSSGLLEVIAPAAGFYVDFASVVPTFGDNLERMHWRVKQVLDYSYIMMYCRSRGRLYMQVEDDVVAMPTYLKRITNRAEQDDQWTVLEFSTLGFIGKLFRARDLTSFIHFFLMFYRDKPVDWLLDDYFNVKVCSPEKDMQNCRMQKKKLRVPFTPSLFQHVGHFSSLKGKIQKLRDKNFKASLLKPLDVNPPAVLSTSLKTFHEYTLEKAYQQRDFFWGMKQSVNDVIEFHLTTPAKVKRVNFVSGNTDHPGDSFDDNTVVELLTIVEHSRAQEESRKTGQSVMPVYQHLCAPDKKGVVDCAPSTNDLIKSVRIRFLKDRETWIILSTILIDV